MSKRESLAYRANAWVAKHCPKGVLTPGAQEIAENYARWGYVEGFKAARRTKGKEPRT